MLPYLARAKAVCQAAQLRAVWDLQHGRQEDARDDLLAAFVLGRNVASDGILISAWFNMPLKPSTMARWRRISANSHRKP